MILQWRQQPLTKFQHTERPKLKRNHHFTHATATLHTILAYRTPKTQAREWLYNCDSHPLHYFNTSSVQYWHQRMILQWRRPPLIQFQHTERPKLKRENDFTMATATPLIILSGEQRCPTSASTSHSYSGGCNCGDTIMSVIATLIIAVRSLCLSSLPWLSLLSTLVTAKNSSHHQHHTHQRVAAVVVRIHNKNDDVYTS